MRIPVTTIAKTKPAKPVVVPVAISSTDMQSPTTIVAKLLPDIMASCTRNDAV